MKVGDKVRFLNTTGGGVVRSFKARTKFWWKMKTGLKSQL